MEYKFVYLIQLMAIVFECLTIESAKSKQEITILDRGNIIEKVFLKRQKRFLIFEKGSTMIIQGNIVKAIISGIPRGLNVLMEYTLSYDLPESFEIPKMKNTKKPSTPSTTTGAPKPPIWWIDESQYPTWSDDDSQWHNDVGEPSKLWCPKQHIFQKYYDSSGKSSLPHCGGENRTRHKRSNAAQRTSSSPPTAHQKGTLLFDLVTLLAEVHGLNARYCLMRILCESKHLLLPPGRLLFHDLVRILLSHAQTSMERHAPFRDAIHRENLQECIQLYGLHCRWSFLQHFTESIATPANSMAISLTPLSRSQHAKFM